MQYKTITLELIQQQTELHDRLRNSRMLLPTVEAWAQELKRCHDAWKETLSQARPGSDPNQIASEALEMALRETETRFSCEHPLDRHEPLSLDNAIAFVRSRTSSD